MPDDDVQLDDLADAASASDTRIGTRPAAPESYPSASSTAQGSGRIGVVGWLRWMWRQLTSMRVALMLLMLLAIVALPGSMLPQRAQSPERVVQYLIDHPVYGPWLDRLGFFDVYTSVWFSAVYLLLFVSLVGCILPRVVAHVKALRAPLPPVPRTLARFSGYQTWQTEASTEEIAEFARAELRGPRWLRSHRVAVREEPSGVAVVAERGYLRESGNIVFHLALVGLLVAVALGHLLSYQGQAIVVVGRGFANSVLSYDTFRSGPWFTPDSLEPFSFTVDSFDSTFDEKAAARDFAANVTVTDPRGGTSDAQIKVNHPLEVDGAKVYLSGNGYAPLLTVRNGAGAVVFSSAVPFIPQDSVYTSRGVVKVPDTGAGNPQLGFVGYLMPTASVEGGVLRSLYPQPLAPMLALSVYQGDLSLDSGVPQSVYQLDETKMTQPVGDDGLPLTIYLKPGETVTLPDGLGTVTFDDLPRFVGLDLRYDPTTEWVLIFALLAMGGLAVSLFAPRRRLWVRIASDDGVSSHVYIAGLTRSTDSSADAAALRLGDAVRERFPQREPAAPLSATHADQTKDGD